MEFEWIDEDGNYTTQDPTLPTFPSLTIAASNSGYAIGSSQIVSSSWTIVDSPTPWADALEEMTAVLRQLQDRLLVIEEKDDEYFKDKAALKKAYDKFRMLEALYGKKKDE
jgi:hypothetical protein